MWELCQLLDDINCRMFWLSDIVMGLLVIIEVGRFRLLLSFFYVVANYMGCYVVDFRDYQKLFLIEAGRGFQEQGIHAIFLCF